MDDIWEVHRKAIKTGHKTMGMLYNARLFTNMCVCLRVCLPRKSIGQSVGALKHWIKFSYFWLME